MANAAAECTHLFLAIVHTDLQHRQVLAVPSAAARAPFTSAGEQEKGPLMGPAASSWGCNLLPTVKRGVPLTGLLLSVPGMHHKTFG